MKKSQKTITIVLIIIFSIYIFFGALILKIPIIKKSGIKYNINEMKTSSNDKIYAKKIDENELALDLRLKIINEAKEFINVSYLTIFNDQTGRIFQGALAKRADEGIKVNIITDGFNSKKGLDHKAISNHPNIDVYFFEDVKLYNPTTINNVMHDKLLIVDNNYGFIGGRNMGDKFLKSNHSDMAYDRDVLVYNKEEKLEVVKSMNDYYSELISSKYSNLKTYQRDYQNELNKLIEEYDQYYQDLKTMDFYLENSVLVDNATFVRSPLNRLNKEPVLFNVIKELSKEETDIIIQSPYFTESKMMKKHFKIDSNKKYTFLTNNINTNPNLPALTNYITLRNKIARTDNIELYESQLENSIHAKSLTIGNNISIIGSQNVDSRSMFLSTESMLVIYSEEFNEKLKSSFEKLINNSLRVNEKGKYDDGKIEAVKENYFKRFYLKLLGIISMFFKELI